jgi:hypothetical protein
VLFRGGGRMIDITDRRPGIVCGSHGSVKSEGVGVGA